jgi:hypothetical protein
MAIKQRDLIKTWFETGDFPTQQQFWDAWDSYWHKEDAIPIAAVSGLADILYTIPVNTNQIINGSISGTGTVALPAGKLVYGLAVFAADGDGDILLGTNAGGADWATIGVLASDDSMFEILNKYRTTPTTIHFTSSLNFSYAFYLF